MSLQLDKNTNSKIFHVLTHMSLACFIYKQSICPAIHHHQEHHNHR